MTLQGGQSARCAVLAKGELYVALLYNSSQNDQIADVIVVWSNEAPPTHVTLPGTTGDQGPAALAFVSGTDTDFLTLSLGATSAASVDVVLVSTTMPTNTKGLINAVLPADGQLRDLPKYTRYHAVPPDGWSQLSLVDKTSQFLSFEMRRAGAIVRVVNKATGLFDGQVQKFGPTANAKGAVDIQEIPYQTFVDPALKGDGQTWVWMSADSLRNSLNGQIGLQGISVISAFLVSSKVAVKTIVRPLSPKRLKSIFTKQTK